MLEPDAAIANPVITYVPLTPERIRAILDAVLDDAGVDGVLVLLAPDALADMPAVARELAQVAPKARKPVVTCFMGDAGMRPLRRMLDDAGTSAFRTPESAADAFGVLATHHYNQQLLLQTQPPEPASHVPDLVAARPAGAGARRMPARAEHVRDPCWRCSTCPCAMRRWRWPRPNPSRVPWRCACVAIRNLAP